MATLQSTGLGNLKGKHMATFARESTLTIMRTLRKEMEGKDHLWLTSLLAVIFADQQSWVSPLDIEVSVEGDAEVLVGHLGDVLDVHADGDEGGLGLQGQVILLVVGRNADPLSTTDCTHQVPPGV